MKYRSMRLAVFLQRAEKLFLFGISPFSPHCILSVYKHVRKQDQNLAHNCVLRKQPKQKPHDRQHTTGQHI